VPRRGRGNRLNGSNEATSRGRFMRGRRGNANRPNGTNKGDQPGGLCFSVRIADPTAQTPPLVEGCVLLTTVWVVKSTHHRRRAGVFAVDPAMRRKLRTPPTPGPTLSPKCRRSRGSTHRTADPSAADP